MNEVEQAVLRWVGARDETRPCDGALRRSGRGETRQSALVAQASEVRQIVPVAFEEVWVHSVYADHDDGFAGEGGVRAPAGREQKDRRDREQGNCCGAGVSACPFFGGLAFSLDSRLFQPFTVSQGWRCGSAF